MIWPSTKPHQNKSQFQILFLKCTEYYWLSLLEFWIQSESDKEIMWCISLQYYPSGKWMVWYQDQYGKKRLFFNENLKFLSLFASRKEENRMKSLRWRRKGEQILYLDVLVPNKRVRWWVFYGKKKRSWCGVAFCQGFERSGSQAIGLENGLECWTACGIWTPSERWHENEKCSSEPYWNWCS